MTATRSPSVSALALALSLGLAALSAGRPASAVSPAVPVASHIDGRAFGLPVSIDLRDLPPETARAAAAAALQEIAVFERQVDPAAPPLAGTIAALDAAAGRGPQPIEPRLFQLLSRAAGFCAWSNGAHGPLARGLYRLWGQGAPVAARPADEALAAAVKSAACGGLVLDRKAGTASLAAGGGVTLFGFAEGAAVDRAVEALQGRGAANGVVGIGRVWRAFGPGPGGRGWTVALPALPGMPAPIGEVLLRDQSLALVAADDRPLAIAGDVFAPLIDQRSGRPVEGMEAVAVRTLEGMDAEALAAGLFVLGTREGQLRVGSVRPAPSVLWALGSGDGSPLLVEYHWSATAPKGAPAESGLALARPRP